jgi:raffinose/stachyose/melibiose transport system permease protein/N-acetylglucosamine transport system permease protein
MEKAVLKKSRRSVDSNVILKWVFFAVFLVYSVTLTFPFIWMFYNSFKTSGEFFGGNFWGLPRKFTFSNYSEVFNGVKGADGSIIPTTAVGELFGRMHEFTIIEMFLVSILLTLSQTFAQIFVSACTAFVVAKYKFKGRNVLFSGAVFLMILPIAGTLPAQYRIMDGLGLINNPLGLVILGSGGFGFTFFMLYGFFKNISWSYAEAAFIDGAGHAKVFFRIILPIAFPALIALAVIYSIGVWNDYLTPMLYLKNIPPLAVGLRDISVTLQNKAAYPAMFASMMIALAPILLLFILFQKTIMQNTIAGGLKG